MKELKTPHEDDYLFVRISYQFGCQATSIILNKRYGGTYSDVSHPNPCALWLKLGEYTNRTGIDWPTIAKSLRDYRVAHKCDADTAVRFSTSIVNRFAKEIEAQDWGVSITPECRTTMSDEEYESLEIGTIVNYGIHKNLTFCGGMVNDVTDITYVLMFFASGVDLIVEYCDFIKYAKVQS